MYVHSSNNNNYNEQEGGLDAKFGDCYAILIPTIK